MVAGLFMAPGGSAQLARGLRTGCSWLREDPHNLFGGSARVVRGSPRGTGTWSGALRAGCLQPRGTGTCSGAPLGLCVAPGHSAYCVREVPRKLFAISGLRTGCSWLRDNLHSLFGGSARVVHGSGRIRTTCSGAPRGLFVAPGRSEKAVRSLATVRTLFGWALRTRCVSWLGALREGCSRLWAATM